MRASLMTIKLTLFVQTLLEVFLQGCWVCYILVSIFNFFQSTCFVDLFHGITERFINSLFTLDR